MSIVEKVLTTNKIYLHSDFHNLLFVLIKLKQLNTNLRHPSTCNITSEAISLKFSLIEGTSKAYKYHQIVTEAVMEEIKST